MKIIISKEDHKDIQEIFLYIVKDSLKYAKETINNIYKQIDKLEKFPYIGRYVSYPNNIKCRKLIYKSYRIVYSVSEENNEICIHFVIHTARDLKSFFYQYKF